MTRRAPQRQAGWPWRRSARRGAAAVRVARSVAARRCAPARRSLADGSPASDMVDGYRFRDWGRSVDPGDPHADQELRPRPPRLRGQANTHVLARLMADRSFRPSLEEKHTVLYDHVETWAKALASIMHDEDELRAAVVPVVRNLVTEMGNQGFLATAAGGADGALHRPLDARSLCTCGEVMARFAGLADFAFAMHGRGTGPIGLFGTPEQKRNIRRPSRKARRSPPSHCWNRRRAPTSRRWRSRRYATETAGDSTARRRGSQAPGSPISMSFSRAPARRRARKACRPSSSRRGAPGFSMAKTIDLIAQHPIGRLAFDGVKTRKPNS